jgi:hypothetical protein
VRRNALLDRLNEEVARSRLDVEARMLKLQEDSAARDARNSETIPVTVGDKTFNLSRAGVEALTGLQAQQEMARQQMVPLPTGGFGSPEFLAEWSRQGSEDSKRHAGAVKKMVAEHYASLIEAGIPEEQALLRALSFGKTFFPDEFSDVNLGDYMPAVEVAISPGEREGGLLDRILGIGRGLNPFGADPVEQLRERMFGPKPPQTLEELQAAREGRLLQLRGVQGRTFAAIPSLPGVPEPRAGGRMSE